ncbi:hypothetical protein ZWY2020_036828 [Hordeum vulgare]|nr:hypothetical protein ZWY2020_036801 [Hordeum vulgare]KAI4989511.1 hypothetical protein ZWY2020_036828 [Hordeum vulgare]
MSAAADWGGLGLRWGDWGRAEERGVALLLPMLDPPMTRDGEEPAAAGEGNRPGMREDAGAEHAREYGPLPLLADPPIPSLPMLYGPAHFGFFPSFFER